MKIPGVIEHSEERENPITSLASEPASPFWIALALIALIWIAHASTFLWKGLPNPDEGYVFQHAREVLAGKVIYRDIVPHIPPLSIWSMALWIKITGEELRYGRFYFLITHGLILLLSFLCLRTGFRVKTAFLAVLPAITICSALLPAFAWYNFDATVWYLLGMLLHLRGGTEGKKNPLASGIAFGLCMLTKTNFGAIGMGIALLDLMFFRRREITAFMAGILAPLTLFSIWLWLCSDPSTFASMVLSGQFSEKGGFSIPLNFFQPFWQRDLLPSVGVLLCLGFAGRSKNNLQTLLGLVGIAALVFTGSFQIMRDLFLIQGLLFLVILVQLIPGVNRTDNSETVRLRLLAVSLGLLASDSISQPIPHIHNACSFLSLPFLLAWFAGSCEPARSVRHLKIASIISIVLFLTGLYARENHPYQDLPFAYHTRQLQSPGLAGLSTSPGYGRDLDELLARIAAGTPGDSCGFLAYPEAPAAYVALQSYSPTRLLNFAASFKRPIVDRFEADDLARLQSRPPPYVLLVKQVWQSDTAQPFDRGAVLRLNRFHRITNWILDHYVVIDDRAHLALLEYDTAATFRLEAK